MRLPFQRDPQDQRGSAPLAAERGDEAIGAARTLARRRLVGAVVLLGAGVVGFPMLFETQPRLLPADLPIVTTQAEVTPATAPTARVAAPRAGNSAPAAPSAAQAPPAREPPAPAVPAPAAVVAVPSGAASAPTAHAPPAVPAKPVPAAAPSPPTASANPAANPAASAPRAASASMRAAPPAPSPAPVLPASKPAPEPAPTEGRFVVQVGAYSDATTLRETRQKVEKLGLKTYTQIIEGDAGKRTRVRVGPFVTRTDAQAAAAKLKAAGLPANLLTL